MPVSRLSERVATRLAQAEVCELNAHYRDDLRIARLTVLHAARGDAVLCSPFVLSTYEVLGLHPSKVWPKILQRREALGIGAEFWRDLPPKKPPVSAVGRSHEKLWCEKANGVRAANSYAAMQSVLREPVISGPMAAPSIAALYPNPQLASTAKKREFSYDEVIALVQYSGAPLSVKIGTLAALSARGRWPKQDGPITFEICVSLLGMMLDGSCCRRTAQRRAKRACDLGFWRRTRGLNSWLPCPKCSSERKSATCPNCGHRGKSRNLSEFRRPFTYEIDIEKFQAARRPREIHSVDWRTYAEYKAAAKRGEHPNVTEMPRKPTQPTPPPDPPPATAVPVKQPAAEHPHRNITRPAQCTFTRRECAKFVGDVVEAMRGRGQGGPGRTSPDPKCAQCHGSGEMAHAGHPGTTRRCHCWSPADPLYRAPIPLEQAIRETCAKWKRDVDAAREAMKRYSYKLE